VFSFPPLAVSPRAPSSNTSESSTSYTRFFRNTSFKKRKIKGRDGKKYPRPTKETI